MEAESLRSREDRPRPTETLYQNIEERATGLTRTSATAERASAETSE